jgi:hypothetical protein
MRAARPLFRPAPVSHDRLAASLLRAYLVTASFLWTRYPRAATNLLDLAERVLRDGTDWLFKKYASHLDELHPCDCARCRALDRWPDRPDA